MKKKTLEEEINEFISIWGCDELTSFLIDVLPLVELYNIEEDDDWIGREVGEENRRSVRIARTAYLLSRLCENHASRMFNTNIRFKKLWERMEKEVK